MPTEPTPQAKEQQLAEDYLNSAILARNVSRYALEQALKDAKAGNLRDAAKTAVNAATASGILLDKRLLLEGRPTQISAQVDPKADGLALLRTLGIPIDTTATDLPAGINHPTQLPASETQPLPAEGHAAKARARARKRIPIKRADP